jgi:hypothetical protein
MEPVSRYRFSSVYMLFNNYALPLLVGYFPTLHVSAVRLVLWL